MKKFPKGNLSITEAAEILGVTPQFLRLALQQGKFPFGVAVKMKRWAYFIHPEQFREYISARNAS